MKEKKLLLLLQKKKGFFEDILEITEKEPEVSIKEWASLLKRKKHILYYIEKIDRELLAFKDSLSALTQETLEEIDAIKILIKRILHLDIQNQQQKKKELKVYGGDKA